MLLVHFLNKHSMFSISSVAKKWSKELCDLLLGLLVQAFLLETAVTYGLWGYSNRLI